jgi:hypothetical protein
MGDLGDSGVGLRRRRASSFADEVLRRFEKTIVVVV